MGSMAFWYEKASDNSQQSLSAVMNFNLWTQCSHKSHSFLDIGFLISNITVAKKLYYFLPFGDGVIDLSEKISSASTIGAIFNEKYSTLNTSSPQFIPVQDESLNQETAFVIYSWKTEASDQAVIVTPIKDKEVGGIILEIDVSKIAQQIQNLKHSCVSLDSRYYFRFRVKIPDPKKNDKIVRKYTPKNSFLQSSLATTYIIDFRFNDIRSLPSIISRKIINQENDFVRISKLHFLLMTKAHVDVETGAKDISLRELETGTWDDYIEKNFETKDIVAFHCSEKRQDTDPGIRQWEFFAKLKVNNSTWKVLLTYFVVLAIITIGFNLLSNYIWELICPVAPASTPFPATFTPIPS